MPSFNRGASLYHSTYALYWRDATGSLLAVEGNGSKEVSQAWPNLWKGISSYRDERTTIPLPAGKEIECFQIQYTLPTLNDAGRLDSDQSTTKIRELRRENGLILGLVTTGNLGQSSNSELYTWFEKYLLLRTEFVPFRTLSSSSDPEARRTTARITDLFDAKIRNIAQNDQWSTGGGREYFMNRVYGFVDQKKPIIMVVPAFPCKSPNPEKVGGEDPDAAEYYALVTMHDFLRAVSAVYKPGAVLWIISDGHVFSDCIGVDDIKVDEYTEKLMEMHFDLCLNEKERQSIQFMGLRDLYYSNPTGPDMMSLLSPEWAERIGLVHPVQTTHLEEAELTRKLLMEMCEPDREYLRKLIQDQVPQPLQLYRGLSRFMLKDLGNHPAIKTISTKQQKKVSSAVATEMILRNQAYSNLVELLYPNYVRLSIHAHNNKGPKFGITLFPKSAVRWISSLENRQESDTLSDFHLPTPWHNSIIKIEGDRYEYLTGADVAYAGLKSGLFSGSWVSSPKGGHFALTSTKPTLETATEVNGKPIAGTVTELEKEVIITKPVSDTYQKSGLFVFVQWIWSGITRPFWMLWE